MSEKPKARGAKPSTKICVDGQEIKIAKAKSRSVLSVRLPDDVEKNFLARAKKAGKAKSEFAAELIGLALNVSQDENEPADSLASAVAIAALEERMLARFEQFQAAVRKEIDDAAFSYAEQLEAAHIQATEEAAQQLAKAMGSFVESSDRRFEGFVAGIEEAVAHINKNLQALAAMQAERSGYGRSIQ